MGGGRFFIFYYHVCFLKQIPGRWKIVKTNAKWILLGFFCIVCFLKVIGVLHLNAKLTFCEMNSKVTPA